MLAWQKVTNQKPRTQAVTLEDFEKRVKEKGFRDHQVKSNVIHFQYSSAAETGLPSPENHCLCPMVETNPAGLSPTYCICSLGYVKEMREQRIINRKFDDPFRLELMVKDMGIAMELANREGLSAPLSNLGLDLWKAAERYSDKGCSISNMVRWIEHMNHTEIKPD